MKKIKPSRKVFIKALKVLTCPWYAQWDKRLGMCVTIDKAVDFNDSEFDMHFEILLRFKPNDSGLFWLPRSGSMWIDGSMITADEAYGIRQTILAFCAAMCDN